MDREKTHSTDQAADSVDGNGTAQCPVTSIASVGASVRGPAHIAEAKPCQDAWRIFKFSGGTILVVADGMGSRPHGDVGAKAACASVVHAGRVWSKSDGAPVPMLLKLVHNVWNILIHPYCPDDCATTCLFALLLPDGQCVAAQLGDGLLFMDSGLPSLCLVDDRTRGFCNETVALGIATSLDEWRWTTTILPTSFTLMLCTDGVAEDVVPEKRTDLVRHLRAELVPRSAGDRRLFLRHELLNWPTPGHTDDKTLIVSWR